MKIIKAKYILLCDEDFTIVKDGAICFDEVILGVGDKDELKNRYPDASFSDLGDVVVMPGLINTHVHLEFSANRGELEFGDFIGWLSSVINRRDDLISKCKVSYIDEAIDDMLKSGITTIGAISSFGLDLDSCSKSDINVVYFNEVLGSNPAVVDTIYQEFLDRLDSSMRHKSLSFIPAISIHSPYSTHPILAKKVLEIARDKKMILSTHFMESEAEREWLDRGEGDFREFFKIFNPNPKPLIKPLEYIEMFDGLHTLFTHLTKAKDEEIDLAKKIGYITHSPRSNRLLGNGRLEVENIDEFNLATDGLSSNNSLSLWDEMRAALMMHYKAPLDLFSKKLIKSATNYAAKALKLNKGEIREGLDSDLIVLELPSRLDTKDLLVSLLLYTDEARSIYIGGKKLK